MNKTTDAEKAVLGALITETTWHWYIPKLRIEYFTSTEHKELFETIKKLFSTGKGVDSVSVTSEHLRRGKDISCVLESQNAIAHTNNFETYVAQMVDFYVSREIKKAGIALVEKSQDVDSAVDELGRIYTEINNTISEGAGVRTIDVIVSDVMREAEEREKMAKRREIIGVDTRFRSLNKVTNGWQKGDLIILAGRPSMGKTAIALALAQNKNTKTLFFSLEMKDTRLVDRIMIAESGVDAEKFRSGYIGKNDWENLEIAANDILQLPLVIDERPRATLGYIRARIMQEEPGLVVIDYLQLMKVQGYDANKEYGEVAKGLKSIAMQMNIPIILLCQLNRATEDNKFGVPTLRNLRDSGEIEQDADLVIFVYRPSYYKIEEVKYRSSDVSTKNVVMLVIAKHRNGRLDNILLKHNESLTKFTDYEEGQGYMPTEEAPY